MRVRRVTALVTVLVLVAVLATILVGRAAENRPNGDNQLGRAVAQARADALAGVAKRIYFEEVYGAPNSSAFTTITALPGLVRGIETGNLALARRTLNHVVVRHAVHERVVRGTRVLADVGLKFVIAGQRRPFVARDGKHIGQIEISIQDVIGFVRLFHRLTGAQIVVHGRVGHAKSSLAAARRLALPSSGPVSVAGRKYLVSSFDRVGFDGEPLSIKILNPTP